MDVVVGNDLWTSGGRRISLDFAGEGVDVRRTAAGWLVLGDATPGGAWLVSESGDRHQLWSGYRSAVLSRDGTRLAYRVDDRIVIAVLLDSDVQTVDETGGIGKFHPIRFVGENLLLGSTETGGGIEHYDMWYPRQGDYRPSPSQDGALQIIGSTVDGRSLVAELDRDTPCLALVNPIGFGIVRRACRIGPRFAPNVSISPDGRWLLGHMDDPGPKFGVAAVELTTVFDRPELFGLFAEAPTDHVDITRCAWVDPLTVYCAAEGGLAKMRVDGRPDKVEIVPVAAGLVVPVMGFGR